MSDKAQASHKFIDLSTHGYKTAVLERLDDNRQSRYAQLGQSRYETVRNLVEEYSDVLAIDGVATSMVDHFAFDIELEANTEPMRHQLPKYSQIEEEKEQFHINKKEAAGHLRILDATEISEWATKVHMVHEKDDDIGTLLCDLRPLDKATVKRACAVGDVLEKARSLAAKRWKSGLDALSGFNQMRASERDSRPMTIITSTGFLQWTCLPFGVTNGQSDFQEMMLTLYGSCLNNSPPSLENSMFELDAFLAIFIDDAQLGSGNATDIDAWQADEDDSAHDGFDVHLEALARVLAHARSANLRFNWTSATLLNMSWQPWAWLLVVELLRLISRKSVQTKCGQGQAAQKTFKSS